MKQIEKLFENNKQWSEDILKDDPSFFEKTAQRQKPEFLWIGCADSRVAAEQMTQMQPGTVFVHRNIANLVIHTDTNMLSVVYYAVNVLKVKHIIVCGHYGCGGIAASMESQSHGFIDNWLRHIKDVHDKYHRELDKIDDLQIREQRLVELNVHEQVSNLAKITFVQSAWSNGEYPYIHGVVYDMNNGILKNLNLSINSVQKMNDIFKLF